MNFLYFISPEHVIWSILQSILLIFFCFVVIIISIITAFKLTCILKVTIKHIFCILELVFVKVFIIFFICFYLLTKVSNVSKIFVFLPKFIFFIHKTKATLLLSSLNIHQFFHTFSSLASKCHSSHCLYYFRWRRIFFITIFIIIIIIIFFIITIIITIRIFFTTFFFIIILFFFFITNDFYLFSLIIF